MMRNNSREQWERDVFERQQNLTPAEITRRSEFRASGLPTSAPLPITIRRTNVFLGAVLLVSGMAFRLMFDTRLVLLIGTVLGVAGLLLLLSAVRWTGK